MAPKDSGLTHGQFGVHLQRPHLHSSPNLFPFHFRGKVKIKRTHWAVAERPLAELWLL